MTLDNQRMLLYSLYGIGATIWFVLYKIFAGLTDFAFNLMDMAQPSFFLFQRMENGGVYPFYLFVTLGITVAAAEYLRRRPDTNKFGIEVITELRKVSWPSWLDVRGTTLVVLAVTFVVAGILWVFDSFYGAIIKLILEAA